MRTSRHLACTEPPGCAALHVTPLHQLGAGVSGISPRPGTRYVSSRTLTRAPPLLERLESVLRDVRQGQSSFSSTTAALTGWAPSRSLPIPHPVTVVHLARNFGQHPAAGFEHLRRRRS